MYWIFLGIFIIVVLIPDIVREDFYFLPQERMEEVLIFLIGIAGFAYFLSGEKKLMQQRRQRKKYQRKLEQSIRDLSHSYSYIGEVNRKMEILMGVMAGYTGKEIKDKKEEEEFFRSLVNTAGFLMKADQACLCFVDIEEKRILKKYSASEKNDVPVFDLLTLIPGDVSIKEHNGWLIISSQQSIEGIRCFMAFRGHIEEEDKTFSNREIVKVLVSQALFLFYTVRLQSSRRNKSKKDIAANN